MIDDPRTLVLWTLRRTLGISLGFFVFYLVAPMVWAVPPLTTVDVVSILGVVFLGVLLGIVISYFWPLPARTGLARAIRTAIFSIPAFGFGMAIHVTLAGAEATRAYWLVFAAATLLGSVYVTADETESEPDDADVSVDTEETALDA